MVEEVAAELLDDAVVLDAVGGFASVMEADVSGQVVFILTFLFLAFFVFVLGGHPLSPLGGREDEGSDEQDYKPEHQEEEEKGH
jgi:hypothetical protein